MVLDAPAECSFDDFGASAASCPGVPKGVRKMVKVLEEEGCGEEGGDDGEEEEEEEVEEGVCSSAKVRVHMIS